MSRQHDAQVARPRGAHRNEASRKAFLELVGGRLAACRDEFGLSQRALARKAGLSADAVGRFEAGDRSPTLGTLYDLATAMDLDVCDLLTPDNSGRDPLQKIMRVLDDQPKAVVDAVAACAKAIVAAVDGVENERGV